MAKVAVDEALLAIQKGEALFTQKTSRQQADTPMFGGRLVKDDKGLGTEGFDDLDED